MLQSNSFEPFCTTQWCAYTRECDVAFSVSISSYSARDTQLQHARVYTLEPESAAAGPGACALPDLQHNECFLGYRQTYPAGVWPMNMLSSCNHPKVQPQAEPRNQTKSHESSARGAMNPLATIASMMLPTASPFKLAGTAKLFICTQCRASCGQVDNCGVKYPPPPRPGYSYCGSPRMDTY